jgi:hypothetical protein
MTSATTPAEVIQSRLKRTALAFRERDWAGIAIEVAVVTLGVLLAFQIDQWAQDRKQARDERQFLERMWRETSESIQENDWVISLHAFNRRALMRGLKARGDPQELARYKVGCGADSLPGLGFNDTSYEELTGSGRLNIVSDPQLRMELRRVAAAQADAVAQLTYSRQRSIPIRQALEPYWRLDIDKDGKRQCRVDWPGLAKDPLAMNAVISGERNQILMWWKRAYTRDRLAIAHNHIACKLGKPDCLKHVPQIVGRRNYLDTIPPALERKFNETADAWDRYMQ